MRKLVALVAMTVGLVSVQNGALQAAAVEELKLKPTDFAIMPWDSVPDDLDVLKGIRECGFNLAGFAQIGALDTVSKAGLQCLVYCNVGDAEIQLGQAEIDRRVKAMVKRVGGTQSRVWIFTTRRADGECVFRVGKVGCGVQEGCPKRACLHQFAS